MSKIVILSSSSGKNLELSLSLASYAAEFKIETEIINLVSLELPLYNIEAEKNGIPKKAIELAKSLEKSRALIFVAPEYNGLVPPVLNNAIAWISRTGNDWRASFNGKIAAIATHSGGGGAHVCQQLSYIGVNVLGRQLLTTSSKSLNPESAKEVIIQLLNLTK